MRQAINLQDPPTATSAVRQLLSATHQRHPAILQEVGETLSLEGDEVRVPVEQLLISFSIVRVKRPFGFAVVGLTFSLTDLPQRYSDGCIGKQRDPGLHSWIHQR